MDSSIVEQYFFKKSQRTQLTYPGESVRVVEVDSFPELGKLVGLRFIEWVQKNPEGVISLPTGKTPEHFISTVRRYLSKWNDPEIQTELKAIGLSLEKPDLSKLHFVQMDEFFPMNPKHLNSFRRYVSDLYIRGFGLDPDRALLMDCWEVATTALHGVDITLEEVFQKGVDLTLRERAPTSPLEQLQKELILAVDGKCVEYEQKIRDMGGIGFFLGGIGPDGHIAFNIPGSDRFSTTRLFQVNYETRAAAAGDLGGMSVAKRRAVVTIGIDTINYAAKHANPVRIIMAAGEAKSDVIMRAVTSAPSIRVPASLMHRPHLAFFITRGAAKGLLSRRVEDLLRSGDEKQIVRRALVDLSLALCKPLRDLVPTDATDQPCASFLLNGDKYTSQWGTLVQEVHTWVASRINTNPFHSKRVMHMAPHHDDIMLGYLPALAPTLEAHKGHHTFNYGTSGFNAVTNEYTLDVLAAVRKHVTKGTIKSPQDSTARDDLQMYLEGLSSGQEEVREAGLAQRTWRNMDSVFHCTARQAALARTREVEAKLASTMPGEKQSPDIQLFKGMMREFEAELLWTSFGYADSVRHLRLGFYKGEYFTEDPEENRDARPITALLEHDRPDIVTCAFDPEGSGPDTHYKVMQAVAQALRLYEKKAPADKLPHVWGYRNVWYRFHPCEANVMVPVTTTSMLAMHDMFLSCFCTQSRADFPAHQYDGPFSGLARKLQVEQLQMIRTLLGADYFVSSADRAVQRATGMVFLSAMTLPQFYAEARALASATVSH